MVDTAERKDWRDHARALKLTVDPFISGKFVKSHSNNVFPKYGPADGQVLAEIPEGSAADVNAAVTSARAAFDDGRWANQSVAQRKAILLKLADLIEANREELALLDTLEVGKPIRDALSIDIPLAVGVLRYCAEGADKVFGTVHHADGRTIAMAIRGPRGVIAGIVGWNFPFVLAIQKLAPALAMGNSLVLKPSELSTFSALRLAALAAEAGVPDGVVNVVPGLGTTVGDAIAHHMDIDMLSFTGSSATGKRLLQSAGASNMKRLLLECGGKSPNIVFADCPDLDAVADRVIGRMFWNQGQVCTAGTRLIVEAGIKDALLAKITARVGAMAVGDPLDADTGFGALISKPQMDKVLNYISLGKSQGADLVLGGRQVRAETGGYYVEPTIFDAVRTDMTIAQDEIFGPVLSVLPFKTVEDAIGLANATIYGLSGTVWTTDIVKAHRMIAGLRMGEITINAVADPTPGAMFGAMPLEAHKQSGVGVESGIDGLKSYTALKSVQIHA